MIAILKDATESITAVLSSAITTTNPIWSLIWKGEGGPANPVGNFDGVTAQTLLTGPSTGNNREIESLTIHNRDTVAATVYISKVVNGTTYRLVNCTIPISGTLTWVPGNSPVVLDANGNVVTNDTVGAVVAGIGVVATEDGFGNFRRVVLTLTNTPITITDALAYAGLKLYDFQAGRLKFLDCVSNLTFTTTSTIASTLKASKTCSYGIGTAVASNTTLATTMMNLMPGSGESVKSFVSSATINVAGTAVTGFLAAVSAAQLGAIIDGTTTAADLYLNVSVPTGTDIDADATLAVNGTITLTFSNGGDV